MRHYRLTLPQCKELATYDQKVMIEALYLEPKQFRKQNPEVLEFATEEEYRQWLTKSKSG